MDILGNFSKLKGDRKKRRLINNDESFFRYQDTTLEAHSKLEEPKEKKGFSFFRGAVVVVFILLFAQVFYLQVIKATGSRTLALGNSIRPRGILSSRGVIFDSSGNWLARNKPSFALGVYPSDIPKKNLDRLVFYQKLSEVSGISIEEIRKKIENAGLSSIELAIIKPNLPREDALILEEKITGIPGVVVDKRAVREYRSDAGLAHILGYTGLISEEELKVSPDKLMNEEVGKTGVEKNYQNYLRGIPGIDQVEVDSKGKVIQVLNSSRQPVAGNNITLNVDLALQQKMAQSLAAGIAKAEGGATSGVAIVENPQTGAILGMVSIPYFDNNVFEGELNQPAYQQLLSDPTLPLLNRATLGIYPSGSVIKIVMAAAGLQEGIINKNTSIETPPEITIGDWKFPDWKWHTGSTNVTRALAESNNIFFYSIAGGWDKIKGLGVARIDKYLSLFGFGNKSGIDLPSEAAGLVPNPEWKERYKKENWYIGDTYHMGIGQGDLLVTPIQMIKAVSAIANGGKLLTPQLLREVSSADGEVVQSFSPKVERDGFIASEHIAIVQEGMRQAVLYGSAQMMANLPVSSAAKTGTAQFSNNQKTHAWFEAYAPYENPQFAIIVLVEGGGGGYEIAEPIAHDIMQYYFSKK